MDKDLNGEQLMKCMASDREWWELRACDVAPWISALPRTIRTLRYNRLAWLGRPWDGVSAIPIGEPRGDGDSRDFREPLWDGNTVEQFKDVVSGADAVDLVAELRRLIAARPHPGVALPDHTNVRACLVGPDETGEQPTQGTLTVDFDLGGMILPLCLREWHFRPETARPVEHVAALMVEKLYYALRYRQQLMARELRMRNAFVDVMTNIGDGAAPLWLRRHPVSFSDDETELLSVPYVMLDIRLGLHQVWEPAGEESITSVKHIRMVYAQKKAPHRRAVARLAEMQNNGSIGWITDVALALIEAQGQDPGVVFRETLDRELNGGTCAHYGCDGQFGGMFCTHGVLHPRFNFKGGWYENGKLVLNGPYPDTLASAAGGRPLAQLVHHPAFVAANVIISAAAHSADRLELHHIPRLLAVEAAEHNWGKASS